MGELDEFSRSGAEVDSGECTLWGWDIDDPQTLGIGVTTSCEDDAALVSDSHGCGIEGRFTSIIAKLTDRQEGCLA